MPPATIVSGSSLSEINAKAMTEKKRGRGQQWMRRVGVALERVSAPLRTVDMRMGGGTGTGMSKDIMAKAFAPGHAYGSS